MLTVTETWKTTYPGASVGILAMSNVANPERHPALAARKTELENQLRFRFSDQNRAMLKALPTIQAYTAYYKRFKKTYHVLLQLESVALKGKSLPNVAALVEAMFMAEVKSQLLTAGHNLEAVQKPIRIDVADGSERFVKINGQEQVTKPGDMYIADAEGILSSVIYGPDQRTRITPDTQQVLFTIYAPPGIKKQTVRQHLEDIQSNVTLVAPEAHTIELKVYGTE
jgi:DNA/RNA-binding domain of Phe-tRNA-synthetase-like protein